MKKEGGGGVAGLLFFATLSYPTRREYTRRRPVSEQTVLEIRCGRKSLKTKEFKGEKENTKDRKRERRDAETRDTLVSCTTSGLLPRNEPTTLLWPVFERKFPRETTVNKERERESNAVFRKVNRFVRDFSHYHVVIRKKKKIIVLKKIYSIKIYMKWWVFFARFSCRRGTM